MYVRNETLMCSHFHWASLKWKLILLIVCTEMKNKYLSTVNFCSVLLNETFRCAAQNLDRTDYVQTKTLNSVGTFVLWTYHSINLNTEVSLHQPDGKGITPPAQCEGITPPTWILWWDIPCRCCTWLGAWRSRRRPHDAGRVTTPWTEAPDASSPGTWRLPARACCWPEGTTGWIWQIFLHLSVRSLDDIKVWIFLFCWYEKTSVKNAHLLRF